MAAACAVMRCRQAAPDSARTTGRPVMCPGRRGPSSNGALLHPSGKLSHSPPISKSWCPSSVFNGATSKPLPIMLLCVHWCHGTSARSLGRPGWVDSQPQWTFPRGAIKDNDQPDIQGTPIYPRTSSHCTASLLLLYNLPKQAEEQPGLEQAEPMQYIARPGGSQSQGFNLYETAQHDSEETRS